MTTLEERYVWAVARLLPEHQRDEVSLELHALIGDMTDARLASPTAGVAPDTPEPPGADGSPDREAVVVEVLEELGDPNRLAARYVERPRALISAEHFPEYLRILKLVASIAIPAITALTVLGAVLDDDPTLGRVLGAALSGAFQSAVQVAFWVTLVYAFADSWKADKPWTPDDLPDVPAASSRHLGLGDVVLGIVFTALAGVALVWQQVSPFVRREADPVPLLHPDIWDGAGQALLALLGLSLLVQLSVLVRRRWSWGMAATNAVVNAAFLAVVAWLSFADRLINPELLVLIGEQADFATTPTVNAWIPVLIVAAIEVWDTAEAFLHAGRASAEPSPTQPPVPVDH